MTITQKFVKQAINPWYGIQVPYNDLVKLPIVNEHLERSIFHLDEQYWCTLCKNTWSYESFFYMVIQFLLQFAKLWLTHYARYLEGDQFQIQFPYRKEL